MAATDFVWASYPLPGADIPCKNTSNAVNLALGYAVQLDSTNALTVAGQVAIGVTSASAVSATVFGIAIETIPFNGSVAAGSIGRIRVYGIAQAAASAAIATGAVVGQSTTAGQLVTYTAANPQVGYACSPTANAADPFLVLLDRAANH